MTVARGKRDAGGGCFSFMASITDSGFTVVYIFVVGVIAVLGVLLFTFLQPVLTDAFSASPLSVQVVDEWTTWFPSFMSWVFGILFVSLPLIGAGLALIVSVDSFWWWIYFALSILILALGWMFDSLWGWFTDVEMIGDAASTVPILDLVLGNYAVYSVLTILFIGLLTYAKRRSYGFPGGFA